MKNFEKYSLYTRIIMVITGILIIIIASSDNYGTFDGETTMGLASSIITIIKMLCRGIRHILRFISQIFFLSGKPFKWTYKNKLVRSICLTVITILYFIRFKRITDSRDESSFSSIGPVRFFGPYVLMFLLPVVTIDSFLSSKLPIFKNIYTLADAVGEIFKSIAEIFDFMFRIILYVLELVHDDVSIGIMVIIIAILPTVMQIIYYYTSQFTEKYKS